MLQIDAEVDMLTLESFILEVSIPVKIKASLQCKVYDLTRNYIPSELTDTRYKVVLLTLP